MKYKKLTSKVFFVLILLAAAMLVTACTADSTSSIRLSHNEFSEKAFLLQMSLTEDEKSNIQNMLTARYVDDGECAGFSKYDKVYDIHKSTGAVSPLMEISNLEQHDELLQNLTSYASKKAESLSPVKENIDIAETYYGFIMAGASDFALNENNIRNTVSQYYDIIKKTTAEENCSMLTHYLYYTVMLDQILNNGEVSEDYNAIVEKVEDVLQHAERISDVRKALEVACAMCIKYDISIKEQLLSEITEEISNIKNQNTNEDSGIVEVYMIENLLNKENNNGVSYAELKANLISGGGYRYYKDGDEPTLESTFDIVKMSSVFSNFSDLNANKEFVAGKKITEGIYADDANGEYSIKGIYYGNVMMDISHGSKS